MSSLSFAVVVILAIVTFVVMVNLAIVNLVIVIITVVLFVAVDQVIVLIYLLGLIIICAGEIFSSWITYCRCIILDLERICDLLIMRSIWFVFFVTILICITLRIIIIVIVIAIFLRC